MSALTAAKAAMTCSTGSGTDAAAAVAAAVDDYRPLLPAGQRERLLAVCLEALDAGDDVESLARDLLGALCPDVPLGVRDTLAWICGDVTGH